VQLEGEWRFSPDTGLIWRELIDQSDGTDREQAGDRPGERVWRRVLLSPSGRPIAAEVRRGPPPRGAWRVEGEVSRLELEAAAVQLAWILCLDLDPAVAAAPLLADPALAPLVRAWPAYARPRHANLLEGLTAVVIAQQVAVTAARTVRRRLLDLVCPEGPRVLSPDALRAVGPERLGRECGLTRVKARALCGLAEGDLLPHLLSPAPQIAAAIPSWQTVLEAQYGIGSWSARWTGLLTLGDLDAAAPDDLGIQEAVQWLDGLACRPSAADTEARLQVWRPSAGLGALHALRGLRLARRLSGRRAPPDLPRPGRVVALAGRDAVF
jgi:3-methyladenine DNA glycosylase/8-oxoguanine DNA glycosylase